MALVPSTHERGFARQVADTVCLLDGGRVLEQGPPTRVLDDPQQERTPPLPRAHPGLAGLTLEVGVSR